jgi:hypothetical protein
VKRRALTTVAGAMACDAFWSPDDDLCHAVVLARDGTLTDVSYDDGRVHDAARVGVVEGAHDLTAFWSETDDERNVTVVTASGQVPHFRQKGAAPWTTIRRRDVPHAIRIAGYDFHHHGVVLTSAGRITDEPFHGVSAAVQQLFVSETTAALAESGRISEAAQAVAEKKEEPAIEVAAVPGVVDIAALWADGPNRFVIAAGADGAVHEFGYGERQPEMRRVLATIPGVLRLNSCYVGDPATGRRVVALMRSGDVHVLSYGVEPPATDAPAVTIAAQDVACFPKGDNVMRIVMLAGDEVIEVVPEAR